MIIRRFTVVGVLWLLLWPLVGAAHAQTAQPDLVPSLAAPTSGDAGHAIFVTWTVTNQGGAQANPTWTDEVFLSTKNTYDSTAQFITSLNHTTALAAGGNYSVTQSITLPNVPAGNYYVLLFTDALNVVAEANESNNVAAAPITVLVPDLVPTTLTAPATGDAGRAISVTWTVANQGTGQAFPTWADEFFLSTNNTYDSTDKFLGSLNHTTSLAPGSSYSGAQSLTLPDVPAGNYYLLVFTDALNAVYEGNSEGNNVLAVPITVLVPDLTPTTLTPPATANPGQAISVTWTVANQGTGTAYPNPTTWADEFFLSTNNTYESTDRFLGSLNHTASLAAGSSYTASQTITVPADVSAGNYYLLVFTDALNMVYETNETNNVLAAPISIGNHPPTANAGGPYTVPEGGSTTLTGSGTDPDVGDTLTYSWDLDNNGTFETSGQNVTFSAASIDGPATRTAVLQVCDNHGACATSAATINVTNVAPTAVFSAPPSVLEGSTIALAFTAPYDPSAADTAAGFTYAFDCGGGYGPFSVNAGTTCATTGQSSQLVKGSIRDKDGGATEYTATVSVTNVAPAVTPPADQNGAEAQSATFNVGSFTDPGTDGPWSVSVDWGDGTAATAFSVPAAGSLGTRPHTYSDSGTYMVTVVVTDAAGAAGSATFHNSIANLPPTATFNAPSTVTEGSSFGLTLTGATDPSPDDQAVGFTYAFDCGDGSGYGAFSSASSATCFAADNGTLTVKGKVQDKDHGITEYSASVVVTNVAPTANFTAASPVNEGSAISLALTGVADPSPVDTKAGFTYAFDCGDGSGYGSFASSATASCPTTDNGTRTVKGSVRDKDGGTTEYSATVIINNVAPSAVFNWPASVNEFSSIALSLTNASDPSPVDTAAGFTYAFDCGNGYAAFSSNSSASCSTIGLASQPVKGSIRDKDGGVSEYTATVSVVLDTTAPTIACAAPDGVWHATDVSIACTASDSGAGLANPADATFTLLTSVPDGTETTNAATNTRNVCDMRGNCATAGPITGNRVDKKAPVVSCGTADSVWHAADVSIACTASDGGAGLANSNNASFTLVTSVPDGTETDNAATGTRSICDGVGHCSTAGPVTGIRVDKKPPTVLITTPAAGATFRQNQPVAASFACADGGSGVGSCTGTVATGTNIDTATPGTKVFGVTATDGVGHTASQTVSYTVMAAPSYQICPLYDQTRDYKAGSTLPIKLQLCDANGNNVSSSAITVTALSVSAPGVLAAAGGANPGNQFRFDSTLGGSGGYIYNLKTKDYPAGAYTLSFRAGTDTTTYTLSFKLD